MDVTNVMDDQTESERFLVLLIAEVLGHLGEVVAAADTGGSLKETSEVSKGANNIVIWLNEIIVIKRATLVKVWKIDEMPS